MARISNGQFGSALQLLKQLMAFSDAHGAEFVGEPARFFNSLIALQKGNVEAGIARMEQLLEKWRGAGCRLRYLTCGFVMARVYTQLSNLTDQPSGREAADRSAKFVQKALQWYQNCIDTAKALGTTAMQGRTFLELGDLHATTGNADAAQDAYRNSVAFFKQNGAEVYLQRAKDKLNKSEFLRVHHD